MTAEEKVGALLLALPSEVGAAVLAHLGPQREARIRAEMRQLQQKPQGQEMVDSLLSELSDLLAQASPPVLSVVRPSVVAPPRPTEETRPAPAPARTLALAPAPKPMPTPRPAEQPETSVPSSPAVTEGPAELAEPTDRPEAVAHGASGPGEQDTERDPVAALSRVPIERLAAVLKPEPARAVALILHHLGPQLSAALLKQLPREIRLEVTVLLSKEPAAGVEIVGRLAKTFLKRDRETSGQVRESRPEERYKSVATMLRGLEEAERAELLKQVSEQDPEMAAAVRENLYEFSDILKMESRSLQKLLGQIEMKSLSVALKDAPQEIVEQVYKNLSKRAGETLKEEVAFLGSVPSSLVAQARKSIVEAIQVLAQAGELFFMTA